MKKYAGAGVIGMMVLATIFLGAEVKFFIDILSLVMVVLLGSLSLYLVPEKKGKAFMEAGWLVFTIGIIAGLFSLDETSPMVACAANVAVSTISLMYGYLFGIIADILLKKES